MAEKTKLTKHAEALNLMTQLVLKQGNAQDAVKGKPGHDVSSSSNSAGDAPHHKNSIGADKNPQNYTQQHDKPAGKVASEEATSTGSSTASSVDVSAVSPDTKAKAETKVEEKQETPAEEKKEEKEEKAEKTAADIGSEILRLIGEKQAALIAEANAQDQVKGKPGHDVRSESNSAGDKPHNKNSIGADKNPQAFNQHHDQPAGKVASEEAEMAQKIASYQLGQALVQSFIQKQASAEVEMSKEAGRRDFEVLIQKAASQLKQAEEAGARAFNQKLAAAQESYRQEQAGRAAFESMLQKAAMEQLAIDNQNLVVALEQTKQAAVAQIEKKAAVQEVPSESKEIKALQDKLASFEAMVAAQKEKDREEALCHKVASSVLNALRSEIK